MQPLTAFNATLTENELDQLVCRGCELGRGEVLWTWHMGRGRACYANVCTPLCHHDAINICPPFPVTTLQHHQLLHPKSQRDFQPLPRGHSTSHSHQSSFFCRYVTLLSAAIAPSRQDSPEAPGGCHYLGGLITCCNEFAYWGWTVGRNDSQCTASWCMRWIR